jgi:hypothetical protein
MAANGKVNTLDKFFPQTPRSGEKRGKDPDSPECISPSLKTSKLTHDDGIMTSHGDSK